MSLYWKCQLAGWSFYGLLAAGIPTLYGGLRWSLLLRAAVGIGLGIFFTQQLRGYMLRHGWLRLPVPRLVPRVAVASLVIAAAMVLLLTPFLLTILQAPTQAGPWTTIYSIHLIVILGWILLYLSYDYVRRVHMSEAEQWRLALAMRDTELRALRAQLNPHFLFNSLNSLRGLISENPARAQEAITELAALLRHTLQMSRARTTTLGSELEATQNYLALEALRFESRLHYEFNVDPKALDHSVPPMLVQTLVENAIKHGIDRLPEGGRVWIDVRKPADDLRIRVRNTGSLTGDGEVRGVGLANSLERLRLIFGERVTLDLRQEGTNEVICDVVLPMLPSAATGSHSTARLR